MCSRKNVGLIMDPWVSQALIGYSCEGFLYRTTQSHLLMRKEVRPNIWSEIPWCKFVKKISMLSSLKAWDISRATARVALNLLKVLTILLDISVRRSAVDQEDLNPYWKSEKRPHFSRWSPILLSTTFSNTLLTKERRLIGQ